MKNKQKPLHRIRTLHGQTKRLLDKTEKAPADKKITVEESLDLMKDAVTIMKGFRSLYLAILEDHLGQTYNNREVVSKMMSLVTKVCK